MEYWYRDKNDKLKKKTDEQIFSEGAVFVGIIMLIALLSCIMFK